MADDQDKSHTTKLRKKKAEELFKSKILKEEAQIELSDIQLRRWYNKGVERVSGSLAIQNWANKLMYMDTYFKKMMGIYIAKMQVIRQHPMNYIDVDMDEFAYDSDRDELENALDDCECPECHAIVCKNAAIS